MTNEPIIDYCVLKVPHGVDPDDPVIRERMDVIAKELTVAQYRNPPKALLFDKIEWLITSNPHAVAEFQPAHDCSVCIAANDQAQAYLTDHPDEQLACANLRYVEVW